MPRRCTSQVVVYEVVDQLAFSDAPAGRNIRTFRRAPLEALVVRIVGSQSVVETEPAVGNVLGVHISEGTRRLAIVQLLVKSEERVVESTSLPGCRGVGVRDGIRTMQSGDRVKPRNVVEIRRRPVQSEQQSVHIVAPLREMTSGVGVGEVAP